MGLGPSALRVLNFRVLGFGFRSCFAGYGGLGFSISVGSGFVGFGVLRLGILGFVQTRV